ncbi:MULTISPECIES: MocR-like pyridoxine biosynthesis transcription factor PdxR [Rhodanobacter]|uniref:PLP-dependent aminotransferase family protein n=1 Tax=Rhodanobacter hydrolyticus TaxID=2250595 RepID=A0ABW8JAH7_9GAMM|nr:PLP-dependent aminotransferase family protein [Rhodanobacter sp. 7MK24]MBD8882057.1 PLP-dependent aminotransferase family protein [Rhodanobacter sp. 7MK24]
MFLELDGLGPHYSQLTRAVKSAILNGVLVAGARLPPTRVLAEELGLSRITVLTAYEQLRAEGYIVGRVGSGSYVSTSRVEPMPPQQVSARSIAPLTRYAKRARQLADWSIATRHGGRRLDMQYGRPQVNPTLGTVWGRELAWAATHTRLEYVDNQGLPALREQICDYVARRRGIRTSPDRVLIVSGTQQAITLTSRVLLDEGDEVALEEPHYFSAWQQFGAHGASLLSIPTDRDGLICNALPAQAPRLVMVTPSHQFPAGPALSLSRRQELLRYARSKNCWILEDDYDGELRYDAMPLPALRSLDDDDRVIYVGTFSKVMFGALRLGYMVLPEALCGDFINAKYLCDRGCPAIEQAALAHFIEDGGFDRHLRHMTRELGARRRELLARLRQYAGARVQVTDAQAGMHVTVWLPDYDHAQVDALIADARERGLGLYSIAPHYREAPAVPGLILGYCGLSKAQLHEAMQLFGECLDAVDAAAQECLPKRRRLA